MFGFVLQLPLPDTVIGRYNQSLSAIQPSPRNVLLIAFGGRRSFTGESLSDTVLIELSEYHRAGVFHGTKISLSY